MHREEELPLNWLQILPRQRLQITSGLKLYFKSFNLHYFRCLKKKKRIKPPLMSITQLKEQSVCVCVCVCVRACTQSCPTLCNSMDCSPPGSSVHGILQARILEWVAISFSRGSSPPRVKSLRLSHFLYLSLHHLVSPKEQNRVTTS